MRRILLRALKFFVLLLVLVVVIGIAAGYWFITRSSPQTSGSLQVPGLHSRVEIVRDSLGVPNIYADNADDLFFAQGYAHAQDRLWQMEFFRHIGHGQLAELFGADYVKQDKFLRTIGLDRAAHADLDNMSSDAKRYLQRYVDGVNAFLHSHQGNLPIEFTLIGDHPADWQPVDVVVWAKVMAYDLSGNYEEELLRAGLASAIGEQAAATLVPAYPSSGPFIIPPEVKSYAGLQSGGFSQVRGPGQEVAMPIGQPDLSDIKSMDTSLQLRGTDFGSNNWVVDGTRTTTGKPLLANDPHLGIQMPSIWYMNGIHCTTVGDACPFDLVGYSFAGVPGIVIGHNRRIGWGVTNVGPDVQDLFIEKINPANPNQYEYQGQWQDMQLDEQVIHVSDGPDVPLTIQITRHGPIMTPVLKGVTATLALDWTATNQPGTLLQSLLQIDRAQNWDEFRAALQLWDMPAQNFVFADVDGNIGYQMPGRVPIRAKGDGTVPVPGWTGEYEWTGYIPFDQLPFVFNPSSHYVVSANNQVVPSTYQYFITRDWSAPFRAMRINELVSAGDTMSPENFKSIQGDVHSILLTRLQKHLVVANVKSQNVLGEQAMQSVKDWDGNLAQDSVGGAILEVTYQKLVRDLFAKRLGPDLFDLYLGSGGVHRSLIYQMLEDPNNTWWDDPATPQRETRDDRLATAYSEGVDWLGSQFGDLPAGWKWGRIHTATFAHPFGSKKPLDLLFNYGPLGMQGDGYTVFNTGFDDTDPYGEQTVSSMRQILDVSNWDQSLWVHTTGESGQPLSAHYHDLTNMWRDVQYATLPFNRATVDQAKTADLFLTP